MEEQTKSQGENSQRAIQRGKEDSQHHPNSERQEDFPFGKKEPKRDLSKNKKTWQEYHFYRQSQLVFRGNNSDLQGQKRHRG